MLVELVEPGPATATETSRHIRCHRGYSPVSSGRVTDRRSSRPAERRSRPVQNILDAILAGDTSRRGLRRPRPARVLPRRHRPQGRGRTCSRASPPEDKDPRKSLHVDDVALPELGPGEALRRGDGQRDQLQHRVDLDLRAGVDVRLPRALRPDLAARQAARPALPRRRLRPVRRRAQDRRRRAPLEARRRGRRALPVGRAGEPRRPQRHDARPRAADLGLRDQLRRPGRDRAGQVQPADAQARAPDLGGGRLPRPGELHGVPPAGQPQRRRHEAGRQRADLGRLRRPRRLRDAVRPQRRRHPGLRGLQRGEGRDLPQRWAPS